MRDDTSQLRVTVLTTLQCNFACDYCVQGDHGYVDRTSQRMSLETAARHARRGSRRGSTSCGPTSFVLTFFGGEPLLNLPVVYFLAERAWQACQARGVRMLVNVITNGLLLTPGGRRSPAAVRLERRQGHARRRPRHPRSAASAARRPGNLRPHRRERPARSPARCRIAIGGNFEEGADGSFVELLDFLAAQDFAPLLDKVTFKPVIRPRATASRRLIIRHRRRRR